MIKQEIGEHEYNGDKFKFSLFVEPRDNIDINFAHRPTFWTKIKQTWNKTIEKLKFNL